MMQRCLVGAFGMSWQLFSSIHRETVSEIS